MKTVRINEDKSGPGQDEIRARSGPDWGQIRARSGPDQGQIKAWSEPGWVFVRSYVFISTIL